MRLTPKNWREFQHYQDRRPPWIKLHRKLLDDRTFACLPLASKALAPLLWLLASEGDENGEFQADTEELMFRLRMTRKDVTEGVAALVAAGMFSASEVLSECLQVATSSVSVSPLPLPLSGKRRIAEKPEDVSEEVWLDFKAQRDRMRAPVTDTVLAGFRREAASASVSLEQAMRTCVENGWRGFRADWLKSRTNGKASVVPKVIPEGYYGTGPAVQDL